MFNGAEHCFLSKTSPETPALFPVDFDIYTIPQTGLNQHRTNKFPHFHPLFFSKPRVTTQSKVSFILRPPELYDISYFEMVDFRSDVDRS